MPWKVDGSTANEGEGSDTVRVVSVSKPYAEALAQRDADLARQVELFGTGSWGPGFYGLGPYETLLGRKVSGLTTTGGKVGVATVDKTGSRLLRDLPANARTVPSPLEATLADVSEGTQLALAVNGTISAVAQAYQDTPARERLVPRFGGRVQDG